MKFKMGAHIWNHDGYFGGKEHFKCAFKNAVKERERIQWKKM